MAEHRITEHGTAQHHASPHRASPHLGVRAAEEQCFAWSLRARTYRNRTGREPAGNRLFLR